MSVKETHSVDKDSGKITQTDYTETRSDGKIETRHLNPDSGKYTGKSVHDPETGKTDYYDRESSGLGGCFLTTACIEYAGLPDNCYELETMRHFRDRYLKGIPESDALLKEYYRVAPLIVQRIKSESDSDAIFDYLLTALRDAVALIESGNNSAALALCNKEFNILKQKFNLDRMA